ncbi:hypothetical protein NC652_027363 [Populus alba x Populus x berolinensis]|uniref:Uncharacterized protein n=1 Tax=Populus alba x Populus x berolinensis TaxID=444605 RepID=A0AAD6M5M1_9ROSI|nr:hypothetical protein NC652_027363 [Populus alba x Populus x berolinensis]KAJ6978869.1 hypothetical protein NC653_027139 [Populus alba x Populus x berolinensis]
MAERTWFGPQRKILKACQALAIGPRYECEDEYVDLHEKPGGKPVIPVGLLPPERPETGATVNGESWRKITIRIAICIDLRNPGGVNSDVNALPLGFIERTSNKGIVCEMSTTDWISGHPSIWGLFFTGEGAVVETSQFGHCLVLLPFIIDQLINIRILVGKDSAVVVDRNGDGSF